MNIEFNSKKTPQRVKNKTKAKNIEKIVEKSKSIVDVSCSGVSDIVGIEDLKIIKKLLAYDNVISKLNGLRDFINLEVIHLQYNNIGQFSGIFSSLPKLQELRLDANEIHSIELSEFKLCHHLTVLNVGYNKLNNIEFIRCIPSLKELIICHNYIECLDDIKQCTQLVDLDASMNQLTDIKNALSGCPSLCLLNVSKNRINSLHGLKTLKFISCLDISSNKVDSIAAVALACPNIEYLDARNNMLTNPDEILMSLDLMKSLREIRIAENPIEFSNSELDLSSFHEKLLEYVESICEDDYDEVNVAPSTKKTTLTLENTDTEVLTAIENQFRNMDALKDIFDRQIISCHDRIQETFKEMPPEDFWQSYDLLTKPSTLTKHPTSTRSRLEDALEFSKANFMAEKSGDLSKEARQVGNREVNKLKKILLEDQMSVDL